LFGLREFRRVVVGVAKVGKWAEGRDPFKVRGERQDKSEAERKTNEDFGILLTQTLSREIERRDRDE
jgi:hypothetical protein